MASQLDRRKPAKSLLSEKAYQAIKKRIQNGAFHSGEFLSERRLGALLGMSKTPIKAALTRLQQEGFVSVSPQQGIVVRELTIREVADQFELRNALETFVVEAITGNLTQKQRQAVRRNLDMQARAVRKESVVRLVELDAEFHILLCTILGNQAILDCLAQHRAKMHRVIHQVMSQAPGRLAEAVAEHEAIFAAIEQGQTAQAVQRTKQHLEFGKKYLISSR